MGDISPGINITPLPTSPGAVTILSQNQAATTDANAVYLLSAVLPANVVQAGSGLIGINLAGNIITKAGGTAFANTSGGLIIRPSTAGIPDTAFPTFAQINSTAGPWETATGDGMLPNAANSLEISFSGYAWGNSNHNRVFTSSWVNGSVANDTGFKNDNFAFSFAPDFTHETLWQFVLVENNAGSCAAPKNFSIWQNFLSQAIQST